MNKNESFLVKIFGEKIGEVIQVVLGLFALMIIFMAGPIIYSKIVLSLTKTDKYSKLLNDSKLTTDNIFHQLIKYDSLTQDLERSIDKELFSEKQIILEKRELLEEFQKSFDSIYLTPQQLDILSSISIEEPRLSFKKWITSLNQLYNIGVSLVISFIFYYLGKRKGAKGS